MTDPKTAARDVATRLANQLIRIKHVQALDLVAAGAGLANRHVLAQMRELPPIKRVNVALLTSAATVLARHDESRRQRIVDTTSRSLLGQPEPIHAFKSQGGTWQDILEADGTIDFSKLRASGGSASAGSDGVVPFLRISAETMRSFAQGSVRREHMALFAQYDAVDVAAFIAARPAVIAIEDDEEGNLYWNSDDGWGDFASASVFADRTIALPTLGLDVRQAATVRWLEVEDAAFRDAVDRALREIDPDQVADDPDVSGSLPLDYDAVARWISAAGIFTRPVGPLEIAVRDGAQRASLYVASLSDDPDTAGGQVVEWISDVEAAFAGDPPSEDALRQLLMDGDAAISSIRSWIEPSDRLWAWLDVAGYPDAVDFAPAPAEAGPAVEWENDGVSLRLPLDLAGDPQAYIETEDGKAFLAHLVRDASFSAWEQDRGGLSTKTASAIATSFLEYVHAAKTDDERRFAPHRAISEHVGHADIDDEWWHNGRDVAEAILSDLADAAEEDGIDLDAAGHDRDEWLDALQEPYEEHLRKNDDSTALDVVHSNDRCEVLMVLKPSDLSLDDQCEMTGPWPDPKKAVLDERFRFGLAKLGWTIPQWRKAVGSEMDVEASGKAPARGTGGSSDAARGEPLVTIDQIKVLLENNCSQFFQFCVYAIVPLAQLLRMDLSRPIAFSSASVATMNIFSGTFMDERVKREVVLQDGVDGELVGVSNLYSPADICGLYEPAYHADVYDPELRALGDAATAAADALFAVDGFVRSHPGIRPYWTFAPHADKKGATLVASIGVYDARRGYSSKAVTATFASRKSLSPEVTYETPA